jgi:hypothetical protein
MSILSFILSSFGVDLPRFTNLECPQPPKKNCWVFLLRVLTACISIAIVMGTSDKNKPLTPRKDDPPPAAPSISGGYCEETFSESGVAGSTTAVHSAYNEDLDELVDFDDLDDSDENDAYSEYERDWNAEFQEVLRKDDSFEKWDALSALSRDFVYAAKVCRYQIYFLSHFMGLDRKINGRLNFCPLHISRQYY